MKRNNINFTYLFILFALVQVLFACKEQDEMFRQYVQENGIVYPAKADKAKAMSDLGSVNISWANSTHNVTSARIWWNNYGDSVIVNILPETDTVRQSIQLPEGIYSFIIRTFDKNGNASVSVEVIGKSIGDKYISNFFNRPIIHYESKGGPNLTVQWDEADVSKGAVYCELFYKDINNLEKTIRIPVTETITVIEDHKPGTPFKYCTFYKPEPENPLVFPTPYQEFEVEVVPLKVIYLEEAFASGIPSTWINIDKDADGHGWRNVSGYYDGIGCAGSDSYIKGAGALSPENYLASPAIKISADAQDITLSYKIASTSVKWYAEPYRILISENPITEENCRKAFVLQDWQELTSAHADWNFNEHKVSLQVFAGKTIYIAFLHGNISDMYGLVIRNVSVFGYY